jgi:hypothetical protein
MFGEGNLGLAKRLEELVKQDLPRMTRNTVLGMHGSSSVIVDDSNIIGLRVRPAEDDAPLIVNTDAVKTLPIAS